METGAMAPAANRSPWAQTGLQTNASGVYTANLGANVFVQSPVIAITPKMAAGSYDWRYTISGTPSSGFTITVTFIQRKNAIDISLGALLGVGLIEASPGIITFDMTATERTA